ncbi:DUF943 family protein [Serratia plymuthica]|uniref:DUF943 family protein n=1 Tax=Serratia plymuthica TaxID=82996 RepID=A0A7T2WCU9_SERPL|nr:DUF943 family protein [Serratia plymuthica]KYQ99000.1 hypothetical protein AWY96_10935 [Serratia plymuthica]QPS22915.1 DUF943 family protein [Serratia plymuthica]QPS55814.1 DUF943 family protein [Serratia plymuthica]QPS64524.1 DUF943 family protein [Serratia plymuthica]RKS63048.1 putative membrane protein DUF943 [Serratia plymuthica]
MKEKIKKSLCMLTLATCVPLGYVLWLSLRPVEIIAVHQRNNYSDVLVKNFPFTEKEKINWWMENKSLLKDKYNIPKPAKDGFFSVIFWDFGDGYKKEEKYDRLCFDDMKTKINCIDKNSLIMVRYSKNTGLSFRLDSGVYRMQENGEMVKNKYQ